MQLRFQQHDFLVVERDVLHPFSGSPYILTYMESALDWSYLPQGKPANNQSWEHLSTKGSEMRMPS
jgi:hypothetical protein